MNRADCKLALDLHAYTMTQREWCDAALKYLQRNSPTDFNGLTPGLYFVKGYSDHCHNNHNFCRMGSMSKAGRKATIGFGPDFAARSAYAGSFHLYKFFPCEETDLELAKWTHAQIVEAARDASLEVPPQVRREHPALFIDIPKPFTAEEVREATTGWGHRDVNAENIGAMIEALWEDVRQHDKTSAPLRVFELREHLTEAELDRSRDSLLQRIAFYGWLIRHLSEGGALYIPKGRP